MEPAEKATLIALVRASPLPHKQVLNQLGLPKSTYYDWCRRGGRRTLALEDRPSRSRAPWNRLRPEEVQAVLALTRAESKRAGVAHHRCRRFLRIGVQLLPPAQAPRPREASGSAGLRCPEGVLPQDLAPQPDVGQRRRLPQGPRLGLLLPGHRPRRLQPLHPGLALAVGHDRGLLD